MEVSVLDAVQILATLLVAIELYYLVSETSKNRIREKHQSALNYFDEHFDSQSECTVWINSKDKSLPLDVEQLGEAEKALIRRYLASLERLAIGVGLGILSYEFIRESSTGRLRGHFVFLFPYISLIRSNEGQNTAYSAFEWLCFELEKDSQYVEIPSGWQNNSTFTPHSGWRNEKTKWPFMRRKK